jgi:hypothetical protein
MRRLRAGCAGVSEAPPRHLRQGRDRCAATRREAVRLRRRPGCGPSGGSRSSAATSMPRRAWPSSAALHQGRLKCTRTGGACGRCASCRHLDVRPLPLHGPEPDDDRPPLRPPRVTGREYAVKLDDRQAGERATVHRVDAAKRPPRPHRKRKRRQRRRKFRSPESDSNRRPLPYHRSRAGGRRITREHTRHTFVPQASAFVEWLSAGGDSVCTT